MFSLCGIKINLSVSSLEPLANASPVNGTLRPMEADIGDCAAVVFTAVPSSGIMISEYFIPDSSRVADVIVIVAEVEFITLIPNAESG